MENEEEEINILKCTPPEVEDQIKAEKEQLIPEKSKKEYKRIYNDFKAYLKQINTSKISENTVHGYFIHLAKKKYQYSTLWKHYSALKKTFLVQDNIDIEQFKKIIPYISSFRKDYVPKQSNVFEPEQIEKFMNDADNKTYLIHKIGFWFGLFGGMRIRDELSKLTWDVIKESEDEIQILITSSKCDPGGSGFKFVVPKNENPKMCPVRYFKLFKETVPVDLRKGPVFRYFQNGSYTQRKIGKTFFGNIPCEIARYLQLENPHLYTGHAIRRTGATLLADSEASKQDIQRFGRWQNESTADRYIENSIASKKRIASVLQNNFGIHKKQRLTDVPLSEELELNEIKTSSSTEVHNPAQMFNNCNFHGTVNIYVNPQKDK